MKSTKFLMRLVIIALLILILRQVMMRGSSRMSGLVTDSTAGAPGDIFNLPYGLQFTPSGFNPDSSYYTKSLTPGGMGGDESFVRNQMRQYKITSDSSGSLLAQ
jgi:hypothetical protein